VKKWLKRGAVGSGVLFFLIAGILIFLLGTGSGTSFLIRTVEQQLDGLVTIGSVDGILLDRLELEDVAFESSAGTGKLGRLVLDWKSSDLLHLHVHVLALEIKDVTYNGVAAASEPEPGESTPFTLPEITLPVTIALDKVALDKLVFTAAPGDKPVIVEQARVALKWDQQGIQLDELSVVMPEGRFSGKGNLNPVGNYPLSLATSVETLSPELPTLKISGEYAGDLHELTIKEQVTGAVRADLQVTASQLIKAPGWQGTLDIEKLLPATFSPDIPGILTGRIKTTGNLQQAEVSGALSLRADKAVEMNWDAHLDLAADLEALSVQVKELSLVHATAPSRIMLSGTVDGQQNLDLQLHWQELQWPLTDAPEYSSNQGKLLVQGPLDGYQLSLDTEASGDSIPEAELHLTARGSTEQLTIEQLTVNTLDGIIGMQGDVQWTPAVHWQLTTDGRHVNPGVQYQEWPGQLDWLIRTTGTLADDGISADLDLTRLEGKLRELPVAGRGRIQMIPETIRVEGFKISSGKAFVSADGMLGESSDLKWQLQVADLSDLLPDAEGRVEGQGTVRGKMSEPLVTAQLSASSVAVSDITVAQLDTEAVVDLSWLKPFSLQLAATDLEAAGNVIQTVDLHGRGTLEDHSLTLSASHELADLALELQGGYREEQWQGKLQSFSVDGADFGDWHLAAPASLTAGATAARVDALCLTREGADICVTDVLWDGEQNSTRGKARIDGVQLGWLSPWFPETLESLDGIFSLDAAVSMDKNLQAELNAEITPGTLVYITEVGKESIPHQGAKVNLRVADQALAGDFSLGLDSNTVRGNLKSPDMLGKEGVAAAAVSGDLFIDAKKFDLVTALVPDITELDAGVDAHFKVRGNLEQPKIGGQGTVLVNHILMPSAGVEFDGVKLDIVPENNGVNVRGRLNSPDGFMNIDGRVVLDAKQSWPMDFSVKSKNFRLLDSPEMKLYLDSDLHLKKKKELFALTGNLTIPKADVWLQQIPAGTVTVSPDVVILQAHKQDDPASPVQMQLKVVLGNNVHFVGMGLNSFIDGQLTLTADSGEQLFGSGEFHLKQGTFRAYSQDLEIQTGVISFPGGPLSQPGINLRATRTIGEVTVGVSAIGPAAKPRLTTFSNPPMSESNIISYLLTGSAPSNSKTGAKLSVGRQINNRLSVSVGTDVKTGEKEFVTRYRISRKISAQTTTATSSNALDIFYTTEFGRVD